MLVQREAASRAQGELRAVQQDLEQERAGNAARVEGLKATLQAQEARSAALDQELRTRPTSHLVSAGPSSPPPLGACTTIFSTTAVQV